MRYRRLPIEIESPEQLGYGNIDCNLTESSVADARLDTSSLERGDLFLAYTDHRGQPELRESLAHDAPGLDADDVLITAGAAAGLFIVATSLLEQGDRIVVEKPNYATNLETPRAIGAEAFPLPLTFEGRYRVDLELLAKLVTSDTKLVSLTAPHNPTGSTITTDDLHAIVELVERSGAILLLDETYRELVVGEPLPYAATLSDRVVSISSMSKAFGMPGIRIGWILCRNRALMETFLAAKEQISICNSVVDENIAHAVLERKTDTLAGIRKESAEKFAIVKNWMSGQAALEWVEPEGGVVCFPRFKMGEAIDVGRFYETLNTKYKTYVGPGHWFDEGRRSMRIGYGWPNVDELRRGLANIGRAAAESVRTPG